MILGPEYARPLELYVELVMGIKPLPDKTLQEMRAGKAVLIRNLTLETIDAECRKLMAAKNGVEIKAFANYYDAEELWRVGYVINKGEQTMFHGEENMDVFPSDEVRAYMVLLGQDE